MIDNKIKLKKLNAELETHIRGIRLIQEEINTMIMADEQGKKKPKSAPLEIRRGNKTYRIG